MFIDETEFYLRSKFLNKLMLNILTPTSSSVPRPLGNNLKTVDSNQRSTVVYDNYSVIQKLGKGGYAKVYEVQCKETNTFYACKVIKKDKSSIERQRVSVQKILKEIAILSSVRHRNIVALHEHYENDNCFFVVMQLAPGGDLFGALRKHGAFNERQAYNVIVSLLRAIEHLHGNSFVHRDIKLENILLINNNISTMTENDVLLTDLGLAKECYGGNHLMTFCGSEAYIAPEVILKKGYGFETDIWSVGVIMYMLLTNKPPFYTDSHLHVYEAIKYGRYTMQHKIFDNISLEAKDLIKRMLTLNPQKRISVSDALQHNWIISHRM